MAPKELQIDEKYDKLIDLSLRRLVWGTFLGGVTSLVLFRGCHTRTAVTSLGAGIGLGSAWQQLSSEFEDLVPSMLKEKK